MPTISRFYGIVIRMYFADHAPAHFHAAYGDDRAVLEIATGRVLRRAVPRALRMVREWSAMHRDDLVDNWHRAQEPAALVPIEPLP